MKVCEIVLEIAPKIVHEIVPEIVQKLILGKWRQSALQNPVAHWVDWKKIILFFRLCTASGCPTILVVQCHQAAALCGTKPRCSLGWLKKNNFRLDQNMGLKMKTSVQSHFWSRQNLFWLYNVQVNLCQKLLFLNQLTHNMTTDCWWSYHEKYKRRTWTENVLPMFCTCTFHVLNW